MSGFSASRAGGSEATKRRSEALTKKTWGEFLEAKDQTLNLNILKRVEARRFFF